MTIRSVEGNEESEYYVSPYTNTLQKRSSIHSNNDRQIKLSKQQSYRYIEAYGLIVKGHTTFFDQHFAITISLPYLLSSSTAMNIELVHNLQEIIKQEGIDCVMYPDDSSISTLVHRLLKSSDINKKVKTVMCRHSRFPNNEYGYELDLIGNEIISSAKNIIILEDETYTGSSIKNMLRICLSQKSINPKKLIIFSVIDSMKSLEKKNLISLLIQDHGKTKSKVIIEFRSFMHFSLFSYWNSSDCPLCQRYTQFEDLLRSKPMYMEEKYAEERKDALKPKPTEQGLQENKGLNHFPSLINYNTPFVDESVSISTLEGQIILFEEAYIKGHLDWLVNLTYPSCSELSTDSLLEVIEILSRNFSLLIQFRVKDEFMENLRQLIFSNCFQGRHLARLMELIGEWPLIYLDFLWADLWHSVFNADEISFYYSYPGACILIASVTDRQL